MTSNITIEVSTLQNKLQNIYWRVLSYIVIWTSVISILFIIKSLLLYFLIPIKNQSIISFMLSPEGNSVQDSPIGAFYETILSLLSMMVSFVLMMIASKAEKLYIEALGSMKQPQAFLFALEIDGVPNINSADFLTSIFQSLQGPNQKRFEDESIVHDVIYAFDMETYFDSQNENRFIKFPNLSMQNQTQSKTETKDNKSEIITRSNAQMKRFGLIKKNNYNGKMIIVLKDLEIVYDILNLFHCGLFETKVQSDVDSAIEMGLLNFHKNLILDALNKTDKNALFHNLQIKIAQDSHDIIWNYYAKSEKEKSRELWWRVMVCIIISVILSFIVGVIYYSSTIESFNVKFVDNSNAWQIPIGNAIFFLNWKMLLYMLALLLIPLMGSLLVEEMAEYIKCDYFSDYNNLRFRLEILFEFIHRYVFLHWAFTIAIMNRRDNLAANQITNLYEYAYIEWNKTAFFLIPTTLLRYLIKHIKGCYQKCKNKATPEKIKHSIDHSISSVNLLLTFMYMGFYFPVLSFSIVSLLTLNIILNLFLYYLIYRNTHVLRDYISYNNISTLINHCLVAFNIGGLMSIFIFAYFSTPYFRKTKEYSGALPSNFIGSIFMLLFAFINYMTNKPNSLYLRVLQNMITIPAYKEATGAVLNEALTHCDYRKKNPYYKEKNRLQSVKMSKDYSALNSDEKNHLLHKSFENLFDFNNSYSKDLQIDNKNNKFTDMEIFAKDLVNYDDKK